MIICKNLNSNDNISSIEEWFVKCPPEGKEKHWVDGRSAKETAKHWINGAPNEFLEILKPWNLVFEICSPELVTKFDKYRGNGRNHDLLILAKDQNNGKAIVAVESKVDEPFDKYIGDYLKEINSKKQKGEPTNADKRIIKLKETIFPTLDQKLFKSLRYQLITAVAGTLVEAKKYGAKKAILLVQTYLSSQVEVMKHKMNQRDFNLFIEAITDGQKKDFQENELLGPIMVAGNEFIPNNVELWIGKYSVEI